MKVIILIIIITTRPRFESFRPYNLITKHEVIFSPLIRFS